MYGFYGQMCLNGMIVSLYTILKWSIGVSKHVCATDVLDFIPKALLL